MKSTCIFLSTFQSTVAKCGISFGLHHLNVHLFQLFDKCHRTSTVESKKCLKVHLQLNVEMYLP